MGGRPTLVNTVRERRALRGWSQEELATRAGLSRAGVGAIESGRLAPSTAAALGIAAALGCRVEDLFRLHDSNAEPGAIAWAWPPRGGSGRYWRAELGGRIRLIPVEADGAGTPPHDGVARPDGTLDEAGGDADPRRTLVVATCDPAVHLLAAALARSSIRLVPLARSGASAVAMLGAGLVHAAGVHFEAEGATDAGHPGLIRDRLGPGFRLLRVARWEEGLAVDPALRLSGIGPAIGGGLRWSAREPGSAARACLDAILDGAAIAPLPLARDHRGVAEAVRSGWAEAGVCLRLAADEAGLDFFAIRREAYDLCYPEALADDPRLVALVAAVRSAPYRKLLAGLPGVDPTEAGASPG